MAIGLPSINISFKELATTVKERSARGIIAMVLKDAKALGLNEIHEKRIYQLIYLLKIKNI